ncbi:protein kinase domain-containing protein [Streptomyces sp. NBC_00663]|uniref:protein kinase domain-containing protein n=1 Tax=Streptomyces sp. NBC_00663 TaxID=2975801 RepID=UPI003FCC2F38
MGRVWRAADEILDRLVAVKEMRIDGLDAEDARTRRERTLREARATARIDHPNVVRVYDVVDEGERLWIVMELVVGRSLERMMVEDGPLGPLEAARIGIGLVTALRQVHARGVLHRDIKPGNVLVETTGHRVVLTDFGIAAIQDAKALTMVGMLVGSPDYMAPERIAGRPQGPPSDIWSLGATLCAALAGHSPFSRDTTLATLHAVLYEEPQLPTTAGALRGILAALLEKEPELRPGLDEVEEALRLVAFPAPTPTVQVGPDPEPPNHPEDAPPPTPHPDPPTPAFPWPNREPPTPPFTPTPTPADAAQPPQGPPAPALADAAQPPQGPPAPALADGAQPPQGPPARASALADGAQPPQGPPAPAPALADGAQPPQGPPAPALADGAQPPQRPPAPTPTTADGAQPPQGPPAPAPALADGAQPPQGPPAPDYESRTGGAGGNPIRAEGPVPTHNASSEAHGGISLIRSEAVTEQRPLPPPTPHRTRTRTRTRLITVAALTTAAAVTTTLLLLNANSPDTKDESQGTPTSSTPTSTAPTSPPPTVEGTSRPQSLPPGAHREAGGFAWATPKDWRRDVKTGAEVHYTSPDGTQELAAKSSLARGDLMDTWKTSEQNAHQGQGYRKIRLEDTEFKGHPAVVWEYTFTLKGVPWHARLLGFNADGKSYQVNTWYQPQTETQALKTYEKVKNSFTVL